MSKERYFTVAVHPKDWVAPKDDSGKTDASAAAIVSIDPWKHRVFKVGGYAVFGRQSWGAGLPTWANEVIYYNTDKEPLTKTLDHIVVHHTDNMDSVSEVEKTHKSKKNYAAIGYHFFIRRKGGAVYEGRPLDVMGSHAGVGKKSGPTNDPDWGAIGITMQGDYEGYFSDDLSTAQLNALEGLVKALQTVYPIKRLLMHREVARAGEKTVCPGEHLVPKVKALRKKLGLPGPK